ncbi:hypothetical protein GYH30_035565 [Glycine max]|nr:hypothetical protein GYH30_035565 [Glycine max]
MTLQLFDVFCYAACFRRGTLGSNSSTLFFITDSLTLAFYL